MKIDHDEFYMLRSLVALAHVDSDLDRQELGYLVELFENLPLSAKQQKNLLVDLSFPQDVESMFKKIESQKVRTDFFVQARRLCKLDNDFSSQEVKALEALHEHNLSMSDTTGGFKLNPEVADTIDAWEKKSSRRAA